jgi:hypothetical protein
MRPLEPQLLRPAEQLAFCGHLRKQNVSLAAASVSKPASPMAIRTINIGLPLCIARDGVGGEDQLGAWAREADES